MISVDVCGEVKKRNKRSQEKVRASKEEPCQYFEDRLIQKCIAIETEIELKSLIMAQIERWRHALHMQVERQHGGNPDGEWRTGE